MAYLVKSDFSRLIAINLLDEILTQAVETSGLTADECLSNAIDMAIAEVKGYLSVRFDMSTEFAKTDNTRNPNVIRVTIHIALYNLHFTLNPHDIPEMRQKIYDHICGKDGELAQVRDGVLIWDLPEKAVEDTAGKNRIEIYSAYKFISKEFTDPQLNPNIP